jgi:hypothetical protein
MIFRAGETEMKFLREPPPGSMTSDGGEPIPAAPPPLVTPDLLLKEASRHRVEKARTGLQRLDGHTKLLDRFVLHFGKSARVASLLLADELITRGIPPAFWHKTLDFSALSTLRLLDLLIYDLKWIRKQYPNHFQSVQYKRYRNMFLAGEGRAFYREAEFLFYQGRRRAWQMVGTLSQVSTNRVRSASRDCSDEASRRCGACFQ